MKTPIPWDLERPPKRLQYLPFKTSTVGRSPLCPRCTGRHVTGANKENCVMHSSWSDDEFVINSRYYHLNILSCFLTHILSFTRCLFSVHVLSYTFSYYSLAMVSRVSNLAQITTNPEKLNRSRHLSV